MPEKMRCAVLVAPQRMELQEVDVPAPGPGEVMVRVRAVGVCGSDLHFFVGRLQKEVSYPYVVGHEFSGEVAAVGDGVEGLKVGQRVACAPDRPCGKCEWCKRGETNVCPDVQFAASHGYPGCLCDYYVVHQSQVYSIPDNLGFVEASICEPMAIGLHVVENIVKPRGGETYALMGAGPDGLCIMTAAFANGASAVYASDLLPERLAAAEKIGAAAVCNVAHGDFTKLVMERTGGRGVDVAIEAAGAVPAIQQVFRIAAIHGRGVVLGIPPVDAIEMDVTAARRRELTVTWARRTVGKYARALDLIAQGVLDTDAVITHRFPFEQSQTAFEYVRDRRDGVLKAVITL
jgi:L-iditol 2-dehydrogenase